MKSPVQIRPPRFVPASGQFIRHELGHATTTYQACVGWLRTFRPLARRERNADPPVLEISEALVRRYSYSLSSRGLRPRTTRGALAACARSSAA